MPSPPQHSTNTLLRLLLIVCLTQLVPVQAYVLDNRPHTSSLAVAADALPQTGHAKLASQLIMQSPSLDNIYKELVVTSKPLNLRKYKNGSKTKKTKKDSKIYYIPIPPLPYRYIPGIGYDYQPMKIKPILQEAAKQHHHQQQQPQQQAQAQPQAAVPVKKQPSSYNYIDRLSNVESKIIRLQSPHHNKEYFFNGRPFRLQVAHAHPNRRHDQLTPYNLKSKFYFNKNIIY